MPKIKISQLPAKAANLAATDLLEVSEVSGLTYVSKKITGSELVGNRVPYTGATTNVDLGEYELKAGQLTLDVSPTGTAAVGTTRWNNTLGSSETTLKGGSVILKNGVDLVARIVNKVTPNATLTKAAYQVVRVSGAQGQRLAVAYAQANNDNNSADTLGLVIETIPTNQEGFIMTVGQIENINTTGSLQGETWADGDVLYLSPTIPGAITKVKPTGATGHIVIIGYVEYAHVNNGKIYVKIMNGWELDELHNVYINTGTLVNDQVLTYESATQLWKNKTPNTGITVGTTSSTGTDGRVFFQAGGVVQQDGAFNWDNTNKRLGIGISTPSTILHVAANYSGGLDALQPQMLVQNTNTTPAATKTSMIRVNVGTGYSGGYPEIWLESQQTAGGAGLTKIRTISNSPLLFYTNDLERARFSETGNFGIGAGASPGARLDVRAQGALTTDTAFRVRNSADTKNLATITGLGDVYLGDGVTITSQGTEPLIAIGKGTTVNGIFNSNPIAIGNTTTAIGNSVAIGKGSSAGDNGTNNSIAIGFNAIATGGSAAGSPAIAFGTNVTASSQNPGSIITGHSLNMGGATSANIVYGRYMNGAAFLGNAFAFGSGVSDASRASLDLGDSFSIYINQNTRALFLNQKSNLVFRNGQSLTSGTHFDANATNTFTIHNGTAPATNISNAQQLYAESGALRCRDGNGDITNLAGTIQSVASAATVTPVSTNKFVKITAQAVALTLAAPTGTIAEGQDLMIRIKDNGTAQTIAWTSGTGGYRAIGVTLPTTTTAGKTTYVGLIYNSNDSIWDVIGVTTQA
jgi:nitrogen fixation protein